MKLSREGERQYIVQQLKNLNVFEDKFGRSVDDLGYYEVRSLLSIEKSKQS